MSVRARSDAAAPRVIERARQACALRPHFSATPCPQDVASTGPMRQTVQFGAQ